MNERTQQPSESPPTPRWLHAWAVLTVCATVPLLFLGAEVTTKQVGMVDPVGFREPWHLANNLERAFRELGFLIEHSHRLLGFLVGTCAIVLALGLWLREPRRWVRWLGVAALAGVSLQGVLGILRVNQNSRELALLHGCSAQLVFALLCSVALFTSRGWQTTQGPTDGTTPFRAWSILLAVLVYLQVVLGAFVRHLNSPVAQRLHMLTAFAVIAASVWLAKLIHDNQTAWPRFLPTIRWLGGLLILQLVLGVEAWIQKYAAGPLPDLQPLTTGQEMVRSGHFLLGSAIFATTVMIALRAHRQASWKVEFGAAPLGRMEGVA